jgi:hypothetical protein
MEDDSDRPPGSPVPPGSDGGEEKPRVQVAPGDTPQAVKAAENLLAATGAFYVSGNALVRVRSRYGQGVSVEQVHEQTLKLMLAELADWEVKGRNGTPVRVDPPHGVVQALLHGQDRRLPVLNGLSRQPFFGADGELGSTPGYDVASGIYAAFEAADYPIAEPTRELAENSLTALDALLSEFQFEKDSDHAAALAAILTATVRSSLETAPAFNITGTGPGAGKSYLAGVVMPFAGPEDAYRVSFPERHDEAGKLVITVLREKPSAVLFDDMQGNWKSLGPLNRALSSSATTERLLGRNTTATVSTRVLFLGTGNQVEPERDMRRRVVTISLAPKSEEAALRSFAGNPVAELKLHRAAYVTFALNIIRAFKAAGSPTSNVRPIGTYEAWSLMCRQPLLWLGLPDPAQSLIDQVSQDPEKDLLGDFLTIWFRIFGDKSVTVRRLLANATRHDDLMEVLEELPVTDGRHISPGKLGWFIRKRRGRRVGGLRFEEGDSSERNSWKVVADHSGA